MDQVTQEVPVAGDGWW